MIRLGIMSLVSAGVALLAQAPAPPPQAARPQTPASAAPAQPVRITPVPPAQDPAVRSVYILPMAGGLDQYLAEHLTQTHAMQVVTDPKTAESFLTDHLGEPFEQKVAEFHKAAEGARNDNAVHPSFHAATSKGTVFLVDAKSKKVIWSDYEKPGSHDSATLNHVAARIVEKMTGKSK